MPEPALAFDADAWAFARDFAPQPGAPEPELVPETPAPVFEPRSAPPMTAFAEPEPAPEPEPALARQIESEPEPAPPPRPRLGVGTFADLRDAAVTPTPPPAAAAPLPEAEPVSAPPVDRAAAFAQVSNAVDAVTTPADSAPGDDAAPATATDPRYANVFSEDLLPQKLPKRGGRRSSSRLSTPWSRDKKAVPQVPVASPAAAAAPAPASAPAPAPFVEAPAMPTPPPAPMPAGATDAPAATAAPGALHFPPGGPALAAANGDAVSAAPNDHPPMEGDDRFAFFAAFRAAAERAREEAGIDDRRIGQ